ncbi:MAG TPA: hypothetical protein VJ547_01360 [Candidatus Thermoplasmatota archaeon]|nr:hypothetical protein [Candidatus Thermoplasmatota archaeon]
MGDNATDPRVPGAIRDQTTRGRAARGKVKVGVDGELDSLVDTAKIIARFNDMTRARLKESTRHQYAMTWRRFAESVEVERYTRRQLAGSKGRELLLNYLETQKKPSWRTLIAHLKSLWIDGMGSDFPLTKRDLPKLPRVGRRRTPRGDRVRPWAEAMEKQPDNYLRVIWLHIGQLGLRPSHLGNLYWSDVTRNPEGKPYAIDADGSNHRFKTHARVRAWLPPDMAAALATWEAETPERGEDKAILPWKDRHGNWHRGERLTNKRVGYLWEQFEETWGLPHVNRAELRHYVKTAGHDARMDEVALAYMQGHEPEGMGGQYDNPEDPETIYDRQRSALPKGPLGTLKPLVTLQSGANVDGASANLLAEYLRGEMSTREFSDRVEALRLKAASGPTGQVLHP